MFIYKTLPLILFSIPFLGVEVLMAGDKFSQSKDSFTDPPSSSASLFKGVTDLKLSETLLTVPTEFLRLLVLPKQSFRLKRSFLESRVSSTFGDPG